MKRFFVLIFLTFISFSTFASEWDHIGNALKNIEKIYVDSTYKFVYIEQAEKIYDTRQVLEYVYFDYDPHNVGGFKYFNHKLDTLPPTYEFYSIHSKTEKYLTTVNIFTTKIPAPVYERYLFGYSLMKAGWATFSIGTGVGLVGGILYGVGIKNHNVKEITAGSVLLGCGGAIIGVSIPLLCFGDNIKRETNTLFETYNILK